jgi:hypothetical protein
MEKTLTIVFILVICSVAISIFNSILNPRSSADGSVLESAMQKAGEGRGTEMTGDEMDAFRRKQEKDSQEHKETILRGLTREEKAQRDYEDEMILKGETKSNSHYEELQRRAEESRR